MRRPQHARGWSTASGLVFILIGYLMGATPASDVRFTDITQSAKVDFKHESSATSLGTSMTTGVVHKNRAHELGGDAEEMCPVLPVDVFPVDQSYKSLVDECGGL